MPRDFLSVFPMAGNLGFAAGVQLLDDCEGTFSYTASGAGGDDVHEYLAAAAWMGVKGLHLKTRTTGAAAHDSLTASKLLSYPESGLLVVRLRLASPDVSLSEGFYVSFNEDNGLRQYIPSILLDPIGGAVSYEDATAGFVAMASAAFTFLDSQWYLVELRYDCLLHQYIDVMVNGVRVSLAGIRAYDAGASSGRGVQFRLSVFAAGAAAAELYADNIYVGEMLGM